SRASGKQFYDIALVLAEIQAATGCWLVVNDRVDIARAVGARGAQLTSHSLQVAEASVVAPEMLIGASVHSVEEAVEAELAGASWCVAGTIFDTPSHKGRAPARIEFVRRLAESISIPVVAIGGVKPENTAELIEAGAYGVATIRGAAWGGEQGSAENDDLVKTLLPLRVESGFVEPVTRYISAYDAVSGSKRNDHPDGERSTT